MDKKRNKPIQIYFSIEEYEEIEVFRNKSGTTKSEFIRQAITDKIMRMKNPEMFKSKGLNGESKANIRQVLEATTDNKEKIDLLIEKMELVIENQKYFEIISKRVNEDDFKEIDNAINELLTEHKIMKLEELAKELEYEKDTILRVLSVKDDKNKPKYIMDMKTGGFKKNE